jgi:hypothetical protein
MVAKRQLALFRDNLQYWHSRESHEPLRARDVRELLTRVGQLVPGTPLEAAATRAVEELRRGRVQEAKQVLADALGGE